MTILNPTLACADPLHLARDIDAVAAGGAGMLHVDVMDGHYVPNFCLSLDQAAAIRAYRPELPVDVHLMVTDPFAWLDALAKVRPAMAAFHLDATPFALRMIQKLRELGIRPGVVLNPSQPVELLAEVLDQVDYVLLMGVEPGFSGQKFFPQTYRRLEQLAALRREKNLRFSIMVDGGIDFENGPRCAALGADILVGGAFVCFGQPDGVTASARRFVQALEGVSERENAE